MRESKRDRDNREIETMRDSKGPEKDRDTERDHECSVNSVYRLIYFPVTGMSHSSGSLFEGTCGDS